MRKWHIATLLATALAAMTMAFGQIDATAAKAKKKERPGCCKICSKKSKPCGNTCISPKDECHQPPGCACAE